MHTAQWNRNPPAILLIGPDMATASMGRWVQILGNPGPERADPPTIATKSYRSTF